MASALLCSVVAIGIAMVASFPNSRREYMDASLLCDIRVVSLLELQTKGELEDAWCVVRLRAGDGTEGRVADRRSRVREVSLIREIVSFRAELQRRRLTEERKRL